MPATVTVTLLAVAVRDPSLVMLNINNEAIKHEFCLKMDNLELCTAVGRVQSQHVSFASENHVLFLTSSLIMGRRMTRRCLWNYEH